MRVERFENNGLDEIYLRFEKEHIANIEQIVYGESTFDRDRPKPIVRNTGSRPARRMPRVYAARIVSHKERIWPRPPCVWLKVPPWTSRKPSTPRSPRSSARSARARSCGSARTTRRWTSPPFPPARSGSISRSASAVCRAGGWSRSTGRNPPARPRLRSTPLPRPRRRAASAPSSMPNTRSTRSMRASSASMSTSF